MDKSSRKRDEMTDFIFEPRNTLDNEKEKKDEYYTFIDDSDFIDSNNNPRSKKDSSKVLAKKILRPDNTYKLMIKITRDNKPYNPMSIYGNRKESTIFDNANTNNKFIQVNNKAFECYLKFIKSKNLSWLNNAEREI
jgi:hypothetical protein